MTQQTDVPAANGYDAAAFLGVLDAEGRLIVQIAREHQLAAEIPFCPEWTMRDLVAHLGFVYRWARTIVAEERAEPPNASERAALADPDPDDDAGLIERTGQAHARLVTALHEAPPALDCWTIWPSPDARDFWIRRQVHETLVHRIDAQNACLTTAGGGDSLPSTVAADGVDEMVCGFAGRYRTRLRSEAPRTLALRATDTGHRWWIGLGPGEPMFGRGPAPVASDTEVHALSGELLLLLWNRRTVDGLDVRGDHDILEAWHRDAHL
jgi:uncharacterized protein (TIGR03083 family)